MKFRYGFYIFLLLNMGCNAKHSQEISNKSKPQGNECQVDKNKVQEGGNHDDAGIEIFVVTEEWAESMGLINMYKEDPGFTKWFVHFHKIPDNPPYSFQCKRLVQRIQGQFYPQLVPSSDDVIEAKSHNLPLGQIVSARGFLPGENITIRLSGKDAYEEITFCPRPLLLKKKNGELLAKATLLSMKLGHTFYELDFCGIGNQEKCKFVSHSGGEILSYEFEGPMQGSILPEVVGQSGGVANITLQLEDGASYSLELPWGEELHQYALGNK
jgi:hypothetical protein